MTEDFIDASLYKNPIEIKLKPRNRENQEHINWDLFLFRDFSVWEKKRFVVYNKLVVRLA